jgi:hypothetical protein
MGFQVTWLQAVRFHPAGSAEVCPGLVKVCRLLFKAAVLTLTFVCLAVWAAAQSLRCISAPLTAACWLLCWSPHTMNPLKVS